VSFGHITATSCPGCGRELEYVDYRVDPPPIPPLGRGGYLDLNGWVADPEDGQTRECPTCELDLTEIMPVAAQRAYQEAAARARRAEAAA
jgi:hypothetical protein